MIRPNLLQKGDTIVLVSPAKAIEKQHIDFAKKCLENWGFNVLLGKHVVGTHHYFSGTEEERLSDFQTALDDDSIKAIICARGGYGCIRLTQNVRWANLLRYPKWIVGFSDVTVLHLQALSLGVQSIHATMPLNFSDNTTEALNSLSDVFTTGEIRYCWEPNPNNKQGTAEGRLIGGNLSILYSLLATPLRPDFEGCILFIEDVGEQIYHLDRMLQTFRLAGIFERIVGLIVGGMTDMKETAVPTGWSVEKLIADHFEFRAIPVCFDAPIGHINDNRAIVCGASARLEVKREKVVLSQSQTL